MKAIAYHVFAPKLITSALFLLVACGKPSGTQASDLPSQSQQSSESSSVPPGPQVPTGPSVQRKRLVIDAYTIYATGGSRHLDAFSLVRHGDVLMNEQEIELKTKDLFALAVNLQITEEFEKVVDNITDATVLTDFGRKPIVMSQPVLALKDGARSVSFTVREMNEACGPNCSHSDVSFNLRNNQNEILERIVIRMNYPVKYPRLIKDLEDE